MTDTNDKVSGKVITKYPNIYNLFSEVFRNGVKSGKSKYNGMGDCLDGISGYFRAEKEIKNLLAEERKRIIKRLKKCEHYDEFVTLDRFNEFIQELEQEGKNEGEKKV